MCQHLSKQVLWPFPTGGMRTSSSYKGEIPGARTTIILGGPDTEVGRRGWLKGGVRSDAVFFYSKRFGKGMGDLSAVMWDNLQAVMREKLA